MLRHLDKILKTFQGHGCPLDTVHVQGRQVCNVFHVLGRDFKVHQVLSSGKNEHKIIALETRTALKDIVLQVRAAIEDGRQSARSCLNVKQVDEFELMDVDQLGDQVVFLHNGWDIPGCAILGV